MLGIRLSLNFNNPYFANSITNFWRRWHISLSTWFRDYVYLPIGGSRSGAARMYIGLIAVFLISGIWHGANFTFIAWALIHLFFILVEKLSGITRRDELVGLQLGSLIYWLITMCIVMLGWIFFRAKNIGDAFYIIETIGNALLSQTGTASHGSSLSTPIVSNLITGLIAALFMFTAEYLLSRENISSVASGLLPRRTGALAVFALILITLSAGNFGRSAFIYFQF